MIVKTKYFGDVEAGEEKIITFEEGLLGFEEYRRYLMFPHHKDNMFKWLQSVEEQHLCFLIVDPLLFKLDYSLEISDQVVEDLKITAAEEVLTYAVVSVPPEDPFKISANLCGPLVINAVARLARQVVSKDANHKIKHYIIDEMKANSDKLVANFTSLLTGEPIGAEENVAAAVATETASMESIFGGADFASSIEEALNSCKVNVG